MAVLLYNWWPKAPFQFMLKFNLPASIPVEIPKWCWHLDHQLLYCYITVFDCALLFPVSSDPGILTKKVFKRIAILHFLNISSWWTLSKQISCKDWRTRVISEFVVEINVTSEEPAKVLLVDDLSIPSRLQHHIYYFTIDVFPSSYSRTWLWWWVQQKIVGLLCYSNRCATCQYTLLTRPNSIPTLECWWWFPFQVRLATFSKLRNTIFSKLISFLCRSCREFLVTVLPQPKPTFRSLMLSLCKEIFWFWCSRKHAKDGKIPLFVCWHQILMNRQL